MIRRLDKETLVEFSIANKKGKKTVNDVSWKFMTVEGRAKRTLSLTFIKLKSIRKWQQEYIDHINK